MIERAALTRFVEDHADKAYCFAIGLCSDADKAADLVQEAFTRFLAHADRLDEKLGPEQWLLTVLKRLYLDGLKRADNRLKVDLDSPIGEGLTVADALPDEAQEEALIARLERAETRGLVRRGLRRMTPEHRVLLQLIDVNGGRYEDAAQLLGVPLNTVRSRLSRARAALRCVMLELEVTP